MNFICTSCRNETHEKCDNPIVIHSDGRQSRRGTRCDCQHGGKRWKKL